MASALTARILDALGADIVSGRIPAGSVLRLDELVAELGVSRTVVRDAIKVLEAQGLVQPRRHIGLEILPKSSWDNLSANVVRWRMACAQRLEALHEISQLRSAIEPLAASLAARQATPAQRLAIDQAALGMQHTASVPDLEAYLAHDIVFHRTLLEASANPLLACLADLVEQVLVGRTQHHLMPERPNEEAVRLHRRVAEAIATGDPAAARLRMQAIVTEAMDAVDELAHETTPPPPDPAHQPDDRRNP